MQEMLEDLIARRAEIVHELEDAGAVERGKLLEALVAIDRVLEDPKQVVDEPFITGDPLVDQWERDIAEGRVPDLTKDMPKQRDARFTRTNGLLK